jgi:hypothetical protein
MEIKGLSIKKLIRRSVRLAGRPVAVIDCFAMLAQYIKNKGFKEGIQQGMQQGKYKLLERILIGRFGALPEWAIQRLESATPEQLDRWAERVLMSESPQGVLSD